MKLKICGMKHNTEAVADLQPDYLGFIFYDKSSRHFDNSIPEVAESIIKTGVFVNEELETVQQLIIKHNLQAVQLHGEETPEYCKTLNAVEVIKVFSIKDEFDFSVLKAYEEVADYFLFDTKGKLPGGNGYTFDWKVLKNYPSTKPYFLSGGIGLQETEAIKEFLNQPEAKYCHAIDINSRFEDEPGLKNIENLKKFKKLLKTE